MSWHKGFRTEPPTYRPVAVVDIGSNSVRLVVYDGLRRSPTPVFNEKILCGLGKGVAITGKLADSTIETADLAATICPVGAILIKEQGYQVPIGQRIYDQLTIRETGLQEHIAKEPDEK